MGRWGQGLPQESSLAAGSEPRGGEQSPRSAQPGSICVGGVNNHRMEWGFTEGKSRSVARESLLSASSWPWLLPSIAALRPLDGHQRSTALPDLTRLRELLPFLGTCSKGNLLYCKPFLISSPTCLPPRSSSDSEIFLLGAANWGDRGCAAFAVTRGMPRFPANEHPQLSQYQCVSLLRALWAGRG